MSQDFSALFDSAAAQLRYVPKLVKKPDPSRQTHQKKPKNTIVNQVRFRGNDAK